MRWTAKFIASLNKEDRANMLEAYNKRTKYYTPKIPDFTANLLNLQKCALCPDLCGFDAPCLLLSKDNSSSPQNKARVGYFVGMGLLEINDPSVISTFYSCMNCDACKQWCPMDISAGELMTEMRQELDKRELIPPEFHHIKDRIEKNGSIFEESPFSTAEEFNIDMPKAKILYYIGCMSAAHRKSMVQANIAILKHLKIPFTTKLENRNCCGSPAYKVGYGQLAGTLAKKNDELIQNANVKLILTDCPACTDTLQNLYPKLGIQIKTPIMHFKDFLAEKIDHKELILKKPINKKVTYHDPCIFARKMEKTVSGTDLLSQIPGISITIPFLNGDETRCCGYGGGYQISNPTFSNQEGIERLEQLRKNDPDYIVSSCPTCEYAFFHAQKNTDKQEYQDEIKDLSELILDSLEISSSNEGGN